jgi:glycosyltransferase involved in cell wall biosynthesis
LRILFTNTGPWGTGSATVVDGVMKGLLRRGHEVRVIFPDSGFESPENKKYYDHPDRFCILKFPVEYNSEHLYTFPLIITDPHPRNYRHAWTFKDLTDSQLESYMDYFGDFAGRVIENFCPDIIECQHIWIMDYVIERMGHRYISTAHHSDQMGFRYDSRMRGYAEKAAKKASHIFAISEYVKNEVLELYPVTKDKVAVMSNGYDQSIFRRKRVNRTKLLTENSLPHEKDIPVITFAGKISKTKGVDFLLMANKIIQKRMEALLLIFGAGDFEDVLDKEYADDYDFRNVFVMGHRTHEDLSSFHNIARVSVLPSRSEGFGIAALEAMGCGAPVVASRAGILEDFVVGSITDVGDFKKLAEQILKILNMRETDYRALREKALRKAKPYSWETIVEKRLGVYESLK